MVEVQNTVGGECAWYNNFQFSYHCNSALEVSLQIVLGLFVYVLTKTSATDEFISGAQSN